MSNKLDVFYMSRSNNWSTPQWLFDLLDNEFHFNLDPCADSVNHKCDYFFDVDVDGLSQDWGGFRVFCNPPYGKEIGKWVKKCYLESLKPNTVVVLLIPSRTDTSYFHDYIYHRAEIRFLRGRIKFGDSKFGAPFPSMVVIFRSMEF